MTMRISGLASGMDVDSIVKQMMQAERIPRDRLFQQKQVMEWRMEAYRDVNSKFLSLRNMAFDLQLQSSFNSRSVSMPDLSGIKVTANSNAFDGSHSIQVTQLASGTSMISKEMMTVGDEEGPINPSTTLGVLLGKTPESSNSIEFTINEIGITGLSESDTLAQFVSKVNSQSSETGVRVNYDSNLGRMFFSTTSTGSEAVINLEGDSGLISVFDLETSAEGKDAVVNYNGTDLTFSTNQFTINGLNIEATQTTTDPVTVTVQHDTEAVFNRIKDFVDQYNELIDFVNGKLDEPHHRDFPPLTNEQKADMTEKEIELWEERAMSGLLRRDSTLSSALSALRSEINIVMDGLPEGALNSLAQIGISTGAWSERGKLHIDETKLREAIATKGDEVQTLFTGIAGESNGLGSRLTDKLDNSMAQIRNTAGASGSANHTHFLGRRLDELDDSISRFDERLIQLESRYYRQFTAMERYINQMNQQSMFLMQQFGGMM